MPLLKGTNTQLVKLFFYMSFNYGKDLANNISHATSTDDGYGMITFKKGWDMKFHQKNLYVAKKGEKPEEIGDIIALGENELNVDFPLKDYDSEDLLLYLKEDDDLTHIHTIRGKDVNSGFF